MLFSLLSSGCIPVINNDYSSLTDKVDELNDLTMSSTVMLNRIWSHRLMTLKHNRGLSVKNFTASFLLNFFLVVGDQVPTWFLLRCIQPEKLLKNFIKLLQLMWERNHSRNLEVDPSSSHLSKGERKHVNSKAIFLLIILQKYTA